MNNFNSVFEELSKLYEEKPAAKQDDKQQKQAPQMQQKQEPGKMPEDSIEEACAKSLTEDAAEGAIEDDASVVETPDDDEVEIEIEDDEAKDEPRQLILECDNCGGLLIKSESDVVVDEETDLVNIEDACEYCEEAGGYKIVGVVAPYEAAVVETSVEESLTEETKLRTVYVLNQEAEFENFEDAVDAVEAASPIEKSAAEEPIEKAVFMDEAVEASSEDDMIDEDLADIYRKTFDKPARIRTQQAWEDELNGEMGEISDKRRKHLEKKFAQQRDWEERHPGEKVKY